MALRAGNIINVILAEFKAGAALYPSWGSIDQLMNCKSGALQGPIYATGPLNCNTVPILASFSVYLRGGRISDHYEGTALVSVPVHYEQSAWSKFETALD